MRNNTNHQERENDYITSRPVRDEVTYNKIQRHLLDINDTITEEDIRNIKILVEPFDNLRILPVRKKLS